MANKKEQNSRDQGFGHPQGDPHAVPHALRRCCHPELAQGQVEASLGSLTFGLEAGFTDPYDFMERLQGCKGSGSFVVLLRAELPQSVDERRDRRERAAEY